MIGVCLVAGALAASVPVEAFTLAWTHSIERIRWEEDWIVRDDGLVLEAVRVRGHGAGMEPPPDAVLRDGAWQWHPRTRHPVLRLTRSGYTDDYDWCARGACGPLADVLPSDGGVTELRTCDVAPPAPARRG